MVSASSAPGLAWFVAMLLLVDRAVAAPLLEGQVTIAKSVSVAVTTNTDVANTLSVEHRAVEAGGAADQTSGSSHLAVHQISITELPPKEGDSYRLETEGIPSKILSVYDNSQNAIGTKFTHPRPIVDTIQEHEKYGNTGDKFYPIGRAIVNGYEGFSNLLNKLLDAPVEIAKTLSRGLTSSLNAVGAKIVGL